MVFLILAIFFGTTTLLLFRYFKQWGINILHAITTNYLTASVLGFVIIDLPLRPGLLVHKGWLLLAFLMGILFIGSFFLLALSSQKAGVAATAIASRMSVVIPVTGGLLLFGETATLLKTAGILLALPSFYLILKNENGKTIPLIGLLLLIGTFFGVGTNDFLIKYTVYQYLDDDTPLFLSVVFFISFLIGFFIQIGQQIRKKSPTRMKSILAGFFLGLVNFGATYSIFQIVGRVESSIAFPLINIGIVILAAMADFAYFGYKLGRANCIGILSAILSIVLIAFG